MSNSHFNAGESGANLQDHSIMSNSKELSCVRNRSNFALSGWIATLLGFYLFATGSFNLVRLFTNIDAGSSNQDVVPELLKDSPVANNMVSITILLSYVVGLPVFAGSALMTLGSLARSAKRLSTRREEKVALNPRKWFSGADSPEQFFNNALQALEKNNVSSANASFVNSFLKGDFRLIKNDRGITLATCSRDSDSGYWRINVLDTRKFQRLSK